MWQFEQENVARRQHHTRRCLVMFSFAHTNFSCLDLAVLSLRAAETASHSFRRRDVL